jgi:integrase
VSASPHLIRRGNTFHFRIAVPRELVARVGKVEIKTTLRTTDPLTARQRSRVLSSAIEALFMEMRRMPELTRHYVERRVQAYFQDCLDKSHELADLLPQDKRSWDRDAEVATLRRRIKDLTRALTDRDFTPALEREVLHILHPDEPAAQKGDLETFRYACTLVLKAKIQDAELLAAELMGEPAAPTEPLFAGMRALGYPLLPGEERKRSRVVIHRAGGAEPVEDAITYSELFRRYRAQRQGENLAPRTLLEMDRAFRLASEVIAPTLPITQIIAEDVRTVRDLIARLPANFDKNEAFAGMAAQRAVEANEKLGAACINPATQVKLFRFFKMPIQWAATEGYIPTVPGASITISAPKTQGDPENGRKPYTETDLRLIFTSPLFTGCASESRRSKVGPYLFRDGWYWVPIIGFYTGMRLAEVVQLGTDDVQQQDGIWFIRIKPGVIPNTGEMKRVKNKAANRSVPVPGDLMKLGFLDVVRRAEKGGRLFPEIRFGHDGTPSKNFSKYWSRYGKAIGFRTDDHVFHSLRHTMADMTRDAKMNMEASTAMMGHTLPGARSLYGKGMSLAPLKEEMDRITPPIDLVALLTEAQRGKVDMTGIGCQSRSRRRPRSLTSPKRPSILPEKRRGRPRKATSQQPKDQSPS